MIKKKNRSTSEDARTKAWVIVHGFSRPGNNTKKTLLPLFFFFLRLAIGNPILQVSWWGVFLMCNALVRSLCTWRGGLRERETKARQGTGREEGRERDGNKEKSYERNWRKGTWRKGKERERKVGEAWLCFSWRLGWGARGGKTGRGKLRSSRERWD